MKGLNYLIPFFLLLGGCSERPSAKLVSRVKEFDCSRADLVFLQDNLKPYAKKAKGFRTSSEEMYRLVVTLNQRLTSECSAKTLKACELSTKSGRGEPRGLARRRTLYGPIEAFGLRAYSEVRVPVGHYDATTDPNVFYVEVTDGDALLEKLECLRGLTS